MGNVNPIRLLRDVPKNAYCEMKLGEILNNHLKEKPISFTLGTNTFHINILPVKLNNSFIFCTKICHWSKLFSAIDKKSQLSIVILGTSTPCLMGKGPLHCS